MVQTTKQAEEARRIFGKPASRSEQRDTGYLVERRCIEKANDEKTKRLKALRLEKEASERAAAAAAAAEKAARPKRAKRAKT